jgi:hypothetical protein
MSRGEAGAAVAENAVTAGADHRAVDNSIAPRERRRLDAPEAVLAISSISFSDIC